MHEAFKSDSWASNIFCGRRINPGETGARSVLAPDSQGANRPPQNDELSILTFGTNGLISHAQLRIPVYPVHLTAIMLTERELQISPIVQESVLHNTKVRALPSSLPISPTTHLVAFRPYTSPPLLSTPTFPSLLAHSPHHTLPAALPLHHTTPFPLGVHSHQLTHLSLSWKKTC